jgi:hypothetical protein
MAASEPLREEPPFVPVRRVRSFDDVVAQLRKAIVLEVRPGKGRGAFAVAPPSSVVGDAVAILLNLNGASLRDLAEFGLSFEPENAWWAAQRAADDDTGKR